MKRLRKKAKNDPASLVLAGTLETCKPNTRCKSAACPQCSHAAQQLVTHVTHRFLKEQPSSDTIACVNIVPADGASKPGKPFTLNLLDEKRLPMMTPRIAAFRRAELEQQAELERLGVPEFETPATCARRQLEMIRRLEREGYDRALWSELSDCDSEYCAKPRCTEGCHYGTRHRRLEQLRTGYRLLEQHPGPLFQVSIVHPVWECPVGSLEEIAVPAAREWNYRHLKALDDDNIVAIGSFEVSVNRELDGELYWAGEIQQIVAGAAKDDLRKAFKIEKHHRSRGSNQKLLKIIAVECLGRQLGYSVKRFVEERRAYISLKTGRQARRHLPPQPELWAEHDAWLLGLPLGARTIAYKDRALS